MLGHRKPSEQNVILMIGESRDRTSKTDISSVLLEAQRQNASIYWLTYSTFLAPFTKKQKTVGEFLTYLAMAGDMHYVCERGKNRMSTQSIAVETMVVSELRNLFADESALEAMLDKLRVSPSGESGSKAVLSRLIDLDLRASRIEILLDSMDRNQGGQVDSAFC